MPETHLGVVLIVEDDAELRFILSAHLRAEGYVVLEAVEGAAALDLAQSRIPDLVIMDIGLPGVDGVSATRLLKADPRTAEIPVIMLSARSRSQDVVAGLDAGAQEYLLKPFDVAELLARVRTVHRLSIARRELDELNAKLEAEVDSKTRRLKVLYEFMRDLNRASNREETLDLVVRCVQQTTGADRILLFLRDARGEQLVCERAVGLNADSVGKPRLHERQSTTMQRPHRDRGPDAIVRVTDDHGARGGSADEFVSARGIFTSLQTPEGVIGELRVLEKENGAFSDEEVGCIRSVADAAAIALDNLTRRDRLQQSVRVLLETVGRLAEYRDEETTLHLRRVSKLARILAEELRREGSYAPLITVDFIETLVQAAPMHDIGKVGIPDDILTKPGKLTDEEFQIMKTHTDIGRRVLSQALDPKHPVPLLRMCIDIAHCHHERFDGKGYPRRLAGRQIPLSARIIALVDAYDAITSARRYKSAKSHQEAVALIRDESGKHFDPELVEAFLRCEGRFDETRAQLRDYEELPPIAVM